MKTDFVPGNREPGVGETIERRPFEGRDPRPNDEPRVAAHASRNVRALPHIEREANPRPVTVGADPTPLADRASARELFAKEIPRFRASERSLHWAIAIPYLLCLLSGVTVKMFFNHLHSDLAVHTALLWVHRSAGVFLLVLPTWVAWRHRHDLSLYLYNVKRAWSWTADDLKWLALIGLASLSKRFALPEQHKFNAGEKINFMTLMLTYPVLVLTGVMLLTPGIHFVAYIAHVVIAVLAAPLILGHLFMAIVNPDTRLGLSGMFSGNVDREWAKHHYAKWYRENFGEDAEPAEPDAIAEVAIPAGGVLHDSGSGAGGLFASRPDLLEDRSGNHPLETPLSGVPSAVVESLAGDAGTEAVRERTHLLPAPSGR